MNNKWIEISYEWANNYDGFKGIEQVHYLDLLGLYETCIMVYDFHGIEKEMYGYGK